MSISGLGLSLVFLCFYGYASYSYMNKAKPTFWLVLNTIWLALFGVVYLFASGVYFGVGLIFAVSNMIHSIVADKLPFNMQMVGQAFRDCVLFPVPTFEMLYGYIKTKV